MAETPAPITDPEGAPAPVVDPNNSEKAAMAEALAKANAEARKYRLEAKAHADALEKAQQQSMTETEKAVAAARSEGRSEGARSASEKIARAEIRAAAAGRDVDVTALLEGIDATRFLDDEGEPDTKAIAAWMDRIAPAPKADEPPPGWPDLGQGARSAKTTSLGDPLLRSLKNTLGI